MPAPVSPRPQRLLWRPPYLPEVQWNQWIQQNRHRQSHQRHLQMSQCRNRELMGSELRQPSNRPRSHRYGRGRTFRAAVVPRNRCALPRVLRPVQAQATAPIRKPAAMRADAATSGRVVGVFLPVKVDDVLNRACATSNGRCACDHARLRCAANRPAVRRPKAWYPRTRPYCGF